MGFSEAQLSAHPSLVMFCKENKFQMAIVSWRSQSDSEQRHGAAVHFSSCVATCRPRVTCRPTWPRLEICTCPHPQLGSRSRTLCITFIYCAGPHYSRRDNLLDIYLDILDARYLIFFCHTKYWPGSLQNTTYPPVVVAPLPLQSSLQIEHLLHQYLRCRRASSGARTICPSPHLQSCFS